MTLHVRVTDLARREIGEIHEWWATNRSTAEAARWYELVVESLKKLGEFPRSSALADENDEYPAELRCLLIGLGRRPTHRALYVVRDETVVVLTVRHVARDRVDVGELEDFEPT